MYCDNKTIRVPMPSSTTLCGPITLLTLQQYDQKGMVVKESLNRNCNQIKAIKHYFKSSFTATTTVHSSPYTYWYFTIAHVLEIYTLQKTRNYQNKQIIAKKRNILMMFIAFVGQSHPLQPSIHPT